MEEPPFEPPPAAPHAGVRGWLRRAALDVRPLRESQDFRRLWVGQAISFVGSMVATVAIPYQMYELTGSALAVGMLGAAGLVPLLVVPLVGGAIADAVDRRKLLLFTEAGLALTSAALALNSLLPDPQVWALYVLEALAMTIFSLGTPSMRSLIPRLVPPDQVAAASALNTVYNNLGAVAGPAAGGLLIAAVGVTGTYLIDVASFSASLISVWLLPPLAPAADADRASFRSILEGLRYVRTQPVVLGIFLVDTNAMIFGMPSALFPALAEDAFRGGATQVGLLYAAPYGGALVASLLSGWVGHVRRQGRAVAIAAAIWGVAIALFGLADAFWVALAFLAVAGAADFVSAVLRSAIVLNATPDGMRGRVSGIEFAQVAGAPSLGNVEAGVVASVAGVRFSIVSGGVACVVGTAVIAATLPALLRYDAREHGA